MVTHLAQRLTLLHRLRLEMRAGGLERSAGAEPAHVAGGRVSASAKQAERWSAASAARRLPAVAALAGRVRRYPRLAEAVALRALWALATGLRSQREIKRTEDVE